jgi:hypothetical protein
VDNQLVDNQLVDNQPSDTQPADNQLADNQLADNQLADNQLADNQPADNQPADNQPADMEYWRKAEGLSGLPLDIQGKQDSDTHLEPLAIHKPMASTVDHSAVESVFRFPHTLEDKPVRPSATRLE